MCSPTIVEKLFHVYDGFVFPHEYQWNKIYKYFVSKGISTQNSHGYALIYFLKMINFVPSKFDIAKTFEAVCDVYFQLKQKMYLLHAEPSKRTYFCCTNELDRGLHQVCICMYL